MVVRVNEDRSIVFEAHGLTVRLESEKEVREAIQELTNVLFALKKLSGMEV
jgi:hypothetical protein